MSWHCVHTVTMQGPFSQYHPIVTNDNRYYNQSRVKTKKLKNNFQQMTT